MVSAEQESTHLASLSQINPHSQPSCRSHPPPASKKKRRSIIAEQILVNDLASTLALPPPLPIISSTPVPIYIFVSPLSSVASCLPSLSNDTLVREYSFQVLQEYTLVIITFLNDCISVSERQSLREERGSMPSTTIPFTLYPLPFTLREWRKEVRQVQPARVPLS